MNKYRKKFENLLGKKQTFEKLLEELETKKKKKKDNLTITSEAQKIFAVVAEKTQKEIKYKISELITYALSDVFGTSSYSFEIDFIQKRNKTEAEIYLKQDGEKFHPLNSTGGGVVDITSFALRATLLILRNPQTRNILLLDESLKHLSLEYQEQALKMLLSISKRLNMQIILISHINTFIDKSNTIILEKIGKKSVIKYISENKDTDNN